MNADSKKVLAAALAAIGLCACSGERAWLEKSHASISFYEQGRTVEALAPGQAALNIALKRFGEHDVRTVYSLDHVGKIHFRLGMIEKAEPFFERTVRLNKELLEDDDPKAAYYLGNLAELRAAQGRFDEAEELYGSALSLYRRAYGEFRVPTAAVQARMAFLYTRWGLHERAEALFRRVDAIQQRLTESDPATDAIVSAGKCEIFTANGRIDEALEPCERAIRTLPGPVQPGEPEAAEALSARGLLYLKKGRLSEAEQDLGEAVGYYTANPAVDAYGRLGALANLGELMAAQGKAEQAKETFTKVLARVDNSYAAIKLLIRAGGVYSRLGELDTAEELFKSAMTKHEDSPHADRSDREAILAALVGLRVSRRDYATAEKLLEAAWADSGKFSGPNHGALCEALYRLSRAELARGERKKARQLAERLDWLSYSNFGPRDSARKASLVRLAELYEALGDRSKAGHYRART
jgi:tetratricopeptide (TPR) repeat protein